VHGDDAEREVQRVADEQEGVVTRAQALACGLSSIRQRHLLDTGRWQRIHRGVYATFSGPVPRLSFLWASVLGAGDGAMLSHETAAQLWGLVPVEPGPAHVLVPVGRHPRPMDGVILHRATHARSARHPSQSPARTRVEDTVVDLTQSAFRIQDAIAWLTRAVGGRFTTAARLRGCLRLRPKLRWRAVLDEALDDVGTGSHSLLELAYLRDVERAHGLPRSHRQSRRATGLYDDVRYPGYRTRVELDGRAAHPQHLRWRDMDRDNEAAEEGDHVLRYGTPDIARKPCFVAAQVARLLKIGGWPGTPRRCGEGCRVFA
jgi:hypothetical protein